MAVNRKMKSGEGQSILEFVIFLPVIVSFIMTLIKVNTAIQVSIVNQQYARAQALYLAFNSPDYPEKKFGDFLVHAQSNQFMLGVSDKGNSEESEDTIEAIATVENIAGFPNLNGDDQPKTIPAQRTRVRVRTTVSMCTPSVVVKSSQGLAAIGSGGASLTESTDFAFCNPDKRIYEDQEVL